MKKLLSKSIYKICFSIIIVAMFCVCGTANISEAVENNIKAKELIGMWVHKIINSGITTSHYYQLIYTSGNSIKIQYVRSALSDPRSTAEALLREIDASVNPNGELKGTATYYMNRTWQLGPPETSAMYICRESSWTESKVMLLPSGDHRGWRSHLISPLNFSS